MDKVPQGIPAYTTPLKLDKALAIPGWMSLPEICWLAKSATEHSRILEIGSYLGRSTRALADNTPGVVLALDDWQGPRDAEHEDNLFAKFTENMQGANYAAYVVNHADGIYMLEGQKVFDMIFLDGSHEYEDVKRDIEKWLPCLMPGGLICGHDYSNEYPTVKRAVTEIFKECGVYGTIWFVDYGAKCA